MLHKILSLMSYLTRILNAAEEGNTTCANQLLPLVYDDSRLLATSRMTSETLDHDTHYTRFANRAHFFAAAAKTGAPHSGGTRSSYHGQGHSHFTRALVGPPDLDHPLV